MVKMLGPTSPFTLQVLECSSEPVAYSTRLASDSKGLGTARENGSLVTWLYIQESESEQKLG